MAICHFPFSICHWHWLLLRSAFTRTTSRVWSNLRISFDFRHCNVVAVVDVVAVDLPCYQCAKAKLTAINLIRFCFHLAWTGLALPNALLDAWRQCIFLCPSPCLWLGLFYFYFLFLFLRLAWGNNLRNWQVIHSTRMAAKKSARSWIVGERRVIRSSSERQRRHHLYCLNYAVEKKQSFILIQCPLL